MSSRRSLQHWILISGAVLILVSGCSHEPPEIVDDAEVAVPDQFSDTGAVWKHQQTARDSDTECLARFFERNPELAGSPELEERPILFISGKTDLRAYWVWPSAGGPRWRCMEFSHGTYAMTEGEGNPFPE